MKRRSCSIWAVCFAFSAVSCGSDDGGQPSPARPDATSQEDAAIEVAAPNDASAGDVATIDVSESSTIDASDVTPIEAAADVSGSDARDVAARDVDSGETAPPKPPFDWVGIIGTGQSLSVGVTAGVITTTQPFKNLKLVDRGPDPKYPITPDAGAPMWATTPLVEPIRTNVPGSGPGFGDGQYPNNIQGETPHCGMANTLSAMWLARGGQGDYVTAHSVVGWSGHCLVDIDKAGGKRAYPASLNEARVWKGLAAAASKTFGYGGITLTHGECDASNASYGAGLFRFWQDYNADLKAITGQQQDVALLVSQQSTKATGAGGSAVQVWKAGVDHPGQIVCTGPKYQYQYSADFLHLPAPGYERLGQKYAEVLDLVVNRKVAWRPLQPNKVTRAGTTITVDFDVPNPPLVWDSHITPPHQTANTEWANGKGFEVTDASGAHLAISRVAIQGASVVITLAADPARPVTVGYALTQDGMGNQGGTNAGLRGLLRDSDEFAGWDAETIASNVMNGSRVVTSAAASGFLRRTGYDIVTGPGVPADTVVASHDNDGQLTLSAPWPGASGPVMLSFRHDERNYCVHFSMSE
jgi:hypothetical protein